MDDRTVVFREEKLVASDVALRNAAPVCPKCSNQTLVLYGNMSFPHSETITEGRITDHKTDWEFQAPLELTGFECLQCNIRYVIESDETAALEAEVMNLREKLAQTRGTSRTC